MLFGYAYLYQIKQAKYDEHLVKIYLLITKNDILLISQLHDFLLEDKTLLKRVTHKPMILVVVLINHFSSFAKLFHFFPASPSRSTFDLRIFERKPTLFFVS